MLNEPFDSLQRKHGTLRRRRWPADNAKKRARRPASSYARPKSVWLGAGTGDRPADLGELCGGAAAEELQCDDADHRDEGEEQRVLDEGGATLGLGEAGLQPGSD